MTSIDYLLPEYRRTLVQLKKFFATKSSEKLKKGEIFLDYGDQSQKLGIVFRRNIIFHLLIRNRAGMDFQLFLSTQPCHHYEPRKFYARKQID